MALEKRLEQEIGWFMEYLIAIAFVFFIGGLVIATLQGIYPKNSHKDKK